MSSANPPPSYNEATTGPGSRGASPTGTSAHPQTTNPHTTILTGDAVSYIRPTGDTFYLVHDQRSHYRAYGQPGTAYVVTGQPATVANSEDPTHRTTMTTTAVILPSGNCPVCGIGNVEQSFNIFLILLAICCFPFGLICCLLLTEVQCTHCHNTFY